jgi:hypothetical protein
VGLNQEWNGYHQSIKAECKSSAMTEECTTQGNMENCSSNSLYIYIILYLSLSFQIFSILFMEWLYAWNWKILLQCMAFGKSGDIVINRVYCFQTDRSMNQKILATLITFNEGPPNE